MTYNVRHCRGMDGKISPERIAEVILRYQPDILALQEVDAGRARSGRVDQAESIARLTDMQLCFSPAMQWGDELYGNAVLSRHPLRKVKAGGLPTVPGRPFEPRGVLWVSVEHPAGELNLVTTHLGLDRRERALQIEALLGAGWLATIQGRATVLCGDFNSVPGSAVHGRIKAFMRDIRRLPIELRVTNTWPAPFPLLRLDHIFLSDELDITRVEVPYTRLTRVASDHLPVIATVRLKADHREEKGRE